MRTPIRVYNVVTSYNAPPVLVSNIEYPNLFRQTDVQIPYPCRIVGYYFSTAFQLALGAIIVYSAFIVVGQSAPQIVVSPTIRTIGCHLYLFRFGQTIRGAQTSALFFKNQGYHVDANEPIAIYISRFSSNDLTQGVLSLYTVPDP